MLITAAIELRGLGELTSAEVDVQKKELLDETSRLAKLKQSHSLHAPRATLTYDGRTIDEWLSILETERSPERLKTALDAIKQLGRESDSQKIVDAIMRLARIYGYKGGQFDLFDKARGIFNRMPKEIVVDAVLRELKAPNQNIGGFLTQFPFWYRVRDPTTRKASPDPEIAALLASRSELLQNLLFKTINTELDPELASEDREQLEWSVSLLVNLLTEFELFKPIDQKALIERISKAIPLIHAVDNQVWLVGYLAKTGVDTSGYEDLLLKVLIPTDDVSPLSPYSNLVFETLRKMGPKQTSQKTIDAITKILSDDKYWQGGMFTVPQPDESKILAIELLGNYGDKSVGALPVLGKIAANKDGPGRRRPPKPSFRSRFLNALAKMQSTCKAVGNQ